MKKILFAILLATILISGCVQGPSGKANASETQNTKHKTAKPPAPIPKGILVNEIPEQADIIFSSIRYVLQDIACLDSDYELKQNFINDPACNSLIYDSGELRPTRQLFVMDLETGNWTQVTNFDCFLGIGQVMDPKTIMTIASCSDTNNNGRIDDKDRMELYLINLTSEKMVCLTCGTGLDSLNNPDYSKTNRKIVFSARNGTDMRYPHHIYTIDAQKNLTQLTNASELDFDCAWSEDGTKIVFNRVPLPALTKPSQVWLMDSDGSNQEKITDGGTNPNNESPQNGVYPIGLDADPDLSPDNRKIAASRLKTGKENFFGIFELIIVDVETKQVEILDSNYANMVPEWKSGGILFLRQMGADKPMDFKQSLYLYKDGKFQELEPYPYNVFPIGAFGGSWIEKGS